MYLGVLNLVTLVTGFQGKKIFVRHWIPGLIYYVFLIALVSRLNSKPYTVACRALLWWSCTVNICVLVDFVLSTLCT